MINIDIRAATLYVYSVVLLAFTVHPLYMHKLDLHHRKPRYRNSVASAIHYNMPFFFNFFGYALNQKIHIKTCFSPFLDCVSRGFGSSLVSLSKITSRIMGS